MANLRNVFTTIDQILLAVKTQLAIGSAYGAGPILNADFVFISLEESQGQPATDDKYFVLIPGAQRPDQGAIAGAAASTITPINGEFTVMLWARLSYDQNNRDDAFITDSSLGALATWRKVIKSLQLWDPQDQNNNYMLQEPMRMADAGWVPRRREPRTGWGNIGGVFEVKYLLDVVS